MSKINCQCGHENPFGTVLCEQCGRPQTEEAKKSKLVDMRYEGASRRSQTYNKSIIDKIWNFFSSVKVGIWIIVAVLATSAIGTIFPQKLYVPVSALAGLEEYLAYYERLYGFFGTVYVRFGFYDMYNSWWFITLVGMLGASIIIASVDRVVPLYKSLKKQRTKRHPSFMKKQRVYGEGSSNDPATSLMKAEEKLKALRYNVKLEDGALLAEKGRFARWGPYVNHAGIIIFLFGILLRGIPGFYVDETMWIREGETRSIPGAEGYYLESKKFIMETYSQEDGEVFDKALDRVGMIASNYQTDVALYKIPDDALIGSNEFEFVKDYSIIVNKPLKFDGFSVFQMDYRLDELKSMTFQLVEKATDKTFGQFTVDLAEPTKDYELENGAHVKLMDFYPDFYMNNGEPDTKTPVPNNPAFIFEMKTPDKPEGERSFVAIQQTLETEQNEYKVKFVGAETRDISGLTVRKDKTLYVILIGGIIFMIGVAQGAYWNHRRIWIQQGTGNELLIAGHTNKNWFKLKQELDQVKDFAALPSYEDRQDKEAILEDKEGEKS
ncbi:cytochrome c biogenesis protein ResB [Sporosarcina sp. YIM B06819]|uniref:cytochrome c biogenesis protein ResB n=1 Tax=Sporosarcina sp. YIM B06819 TaxID=3081769 RepID=UPI00298CD409|nr:cytochrome c biogenesis protein ResB [Sporosarcina sp. YIM B06819]